MAGPSGPHRICKAGRHCLALTGATPDNRCLECRRESHRRAQARYYGTAKGQHTAMRWEAKERK